MKKLLILFLLIFSSCTLHDDISSSTDNLQLLTSDTELNADGLNGYNDIIAFCYADYSNGFDETVKLYQYESNNPDGVLYLDSIALGVGDKKLVDIEVNEDWVTVTMNSYTTPVSVVALISLSDLSNLSLTKKFNYNNASDSAVANQSYLLVSNGTSLKIYEISTGNLMADFSIVSEVSSAVALNNGFFVITGNGYVVVDTSDPSSIDYNSYSNDDIKGSEKSYLYGNMLYIAGPSKYVGKTKIAKVDITNPLSPVMVLLKDDINKTYMDFSYDTDGSYYLVTGTEIIKYIESGNRLVFDSSSSLDYFDHGLSVIHAINQRLFLNGMDVYKFE
jgi:hypothetical protein